MHYFCSFGSEERCPSRKAKKLLYLKLKREALKRGGGGGAGARIELAGTLQISVASAVTGTESHGTLVYRPTTEDTAPGQTNHAKPYKPKQVKFKVARRHKHPLDIPKPCTSVHQAALDNNECKQAAC